MALSDCAECDGTGLAAGSQTHFACPLCTKQPSSDDIPLVWIRPFDNELTPINNRGEPWNPLNDDGDALRLACKLRINIEHAETLSRKAHGVNCWPVGRGDCGYIENDFTDYNAATRRAIISAAAKVGKAMP